MKRNLCSLLITLFVLLFICLCTFVEAAIVTISPTSWYQINNPYYGDGTVWNPAVPEIIRSGNSLAGVFWNFDLDACGQLNSAHINYSYQQPTEHLSARIVVFTGTTNWPHDPTPSIFTRSANFGQTGDYGWKSESVDITEGIQFAIDHNYYQITIGFEPEFPWDNSYQAYFNPGFTNLDYTPVPLPTSGWLLYSGLLAVLKFRKQ